MYETISCAVYSDRKVQGVMRTNKGGPGSVKKVFVNLSL